MSQTTTPAPQPPDKSELMNSIVGGVSSASDPHDLGDVKESLKKLQNGIAVYMGDHTALTRLFTGQKVFVDTEDVSEAPHLILDGYWEEDITKAFMRIVRPGDTVFDAGSTFGYYGIIAGSITHSQGHRGSLHFFDPNEVYEPFVKKSLRVNGLLEDSRINTLGISADGKSVKIQEFKDDWNSNTTISMDEFKKYRVLNDDFVIKTIKTTTLDDYCDKYSIETVDVLKMDIEGMEQAAYKGAAKIIKRSDRLKLIMEFTPDYYDDPTAFFKKISSDFPYLYTISNHGTLVPFSEYGQLTARLRSSRWLMMVASKERV